MRWTFWHVVGGVTGLAVAAAVAAGWFTGPGVAAKTVQTTAMPHQERAVVLGGDIVLDDIVEEVADAPVRSVPAQARVQWAADRAAWRGGGWVLCDVSAFDGSLGEVIFDERGWHGLIDPATSIMSVEDGRLALAVTEPEGEVRMSVGGLWGASHRVRIAWSEADGEQPGFCEPVVEVPLDAELQVHLVEADGQALIDDDDVVVELNGCGYTSEDGAQTPVESAPCTLQVVRRRRTLPSQVTRATPVYIEPIAGELTTVTVTLPPPPGPWRVPNIADTLLLLDVAAYSGSEVLADALDMVVDDVQDGAFDPEVVQMAYELSDADTPDSAYDVIGTSWQLWGVVQEAGEP